MRWAFRLVETGRDGEVRSTNVVELIRPGDLTEISGLGLNLAEAKQLQARVQQREFAATQAMSHATVRPNCQSCGRACHIKDYRDHHIATLFGQVTGSRQSASVSVGNMRCRGYWYPVALKLPLDTRDG